ncbi:MAG: gentisate 1,2-dioxygenase, partial [Pseudomonadota bacterium]|nr:gentisate 1,2-dioxygenase [Pseudomonadota bacterium]
RGPRDIFVVPSGQPVVHEAGEETNFFSFSNRPVQEELALWREKMG